MLIRLLLVVAMLAGPLPARACNCAASDHGVPASPTATPPVAIPDHSETESCACAHRTKKQRTDVASTTANVVQTAVHESSGHSDKHDRDCPALSPPAQVVVGIQSGTVDIATDFLDLVPHLNLSASGEPTRLPSWPDREPSSRSVPRYISFLTLRN